jgi:hypothetical protein
MSELEELRKIKQDYAHVLMLLDFPDKFVDGFTAAKKILADKQEAKIEGAEQALNDFISSPAAIEAMFKTLSGHIDYETDDKLKEALTAAVEAYLKEKKEGK